MSVLCNRYSRRKLLYLGAAVYAVGLHISAYAESLSYMYFSYGLVSGASSLAAMFEAKYTRRDTL